MKTYHVIASYISYCETTVEANSQEEAERLASELDGGSFTPTHGNSDWQIAVVRELQPTKE